MKIIVQIYIIFFLTIFAFGQLENPKIRKGNDLYTQGVYSAAEAQFQKAQQINPKSVIAKNNFGLAQYKQKNYQGAIQTFSELTQNVKNNDTLAKIYYNLGNSYTRLAENAISKQNKQEAIQNLQQAVNAYKKSILLDPKDKEAKVNYTIAKEYLEQLLKNQRNQNQQNQQQQQQNQNQQQQNQNQQQDSTQQNNPKQQTGKDTDHDGIPDKIEKQNNQGQQAQTPTDTDNDGIPDYEDTDSDNDNIPDNIEAGKNPSEPKDTDHDGIPDYRDTDSNNNGILDKDEKVAIPYEEMVRLLKAIENQDIKTYQKAQQKLQIKHKSTSKNW